MTDDLIKKAKDDLMFFNEGDWITKEMDASAKILENYIEFLERRQPMRDKARIKPFMEELTKLWEEKCPDWRFGQLMSNVLNSMPNDPFFPEEPEMLEYFKNYFKKR